MKKLAQILFPLIAIGLFIFTWSASIQGNGDWSATWTSDLGQTYFNIFRLAGLTAFTLVALQIITGPYMRFWEQLYGPKFYLAHTVGGVLALVFALLHPTLLMVSLGYRGISPLDFASNYPFQYYFGPIALFLIIVTTATAWMWVTLHRPKYKGLWHWIHLANYAVFALVFFHSLTIGTDVAPAISQLRPLWYTYAALAVIGLVYRRFVQVRQEKTHGLNS